MSLKNSSPDENMTIINVDEWDPPELSTTAWTMAAASKKGRRAYGRHNNNIVKKQPMVRRGSKKRALDEENKDSYHDQLDMAPMKRNSSHSSVEPDFTSTTKGSSDVSSFRASFNSSSSSSLYEGWNDAENTNPNLQESPLPPAKVKKVQSDVIAHSPSFSHLAKSGTSWVNGPIRSVSSPLPPCSPALSEGFFSSGKRGVCDSPMSDEATRSLGSITRSSRSRRSRSSSLGRSRRIPPKLPFSATKPQVINTRSLHHDRDDDDSDEEADDSDAGEHNRSLNESFESADGNNNLFGGGSSFGKQPPSALPPPPSSLLPPKPVRRCSSFFDGFDQSVFGGGTKTSANNNKVFESMSSYRDLKFLIRALRKEQNGTTSFGLKRSWTVAPPVAWPPKRRTAFLQWTLTLGFSIRSGGGSLTFCQANATKGETVLGVLEEALIEYKKKEMETKAPPPENAVIVDCTNEPPLFSPTIPTTERSSEKIPFPKLCNPFEDRTVEVDLLQAVDSLTFSESQTTAAEAQKPLVRSVTLDTKVSSDDQQQFQPTSNFPSFEKEYVDDLGFITNQPNRLSSTLPCFEEEDDDDYFDSSFDASRPSRLSSENHVSGQDFMDHLLGSFSPREMSIGNNSTRKSRTLFGRGRNSKGSARNSVSPMPTSTTKQQALNFALPEFVETPMLKKNPQDWGSSRGRDWGVSTQCEKNIIDELISCFEEAYAESGHAPESLLMDSEQASLCMVQSNISTNNLGFEFEMDNDHAVTQSHIIIQTDEGGSTEKQKPGHSRRASVGSTIFEKLNLNDGERSPEKSRRRRQVSFAKIKRMSLCAEPMRRLSMTRQSMFARQPTQDAIDMVSRNSFVLSDRTSFPLWSLEKAPRLPKPEVSPVAQGLADPKILNNILLFLREPELLHSASLVCSDWADAATEAHASLMLISVGCSGLFGGDQNQIEELGDDDDDDSNTCQDLSAESIARSMERSWKFLIGMFPWANFLSEGAFKRVYRVFNTSIQAEEAVSVMNVETIESLGNKDVVGAELAVSVMLSSLARRNVCPNFIITRGVFTCPYEPPSSHWGSAEDKYPKGKKYGKAPLGRRPREPSRNNRGRFQYIRMELCSEGDMEEYIKRQPDEIMELWEGQSMIFQVAFALHAAGDRFSMKHYDLKLLNVFLQKANVGDTAVGDDSFTVLQYGVGRHTFNLRMPSKQALIAKVADYGTANVQAESDGQPINISQFTTLENTPPEFFIMGDAATQGYGHDRWGLGLCMLHTFTGHAPYEEILEEVTCPPTLKEKLELIWQDERSTGYDVIRSVILADVDIDEDGNVEGEADQVLYDTFYRYLVLFGIPEKKFMSKEHGKVWRAVSSSLEKADRSRGRKAAVRNYGADAARFLRDQKKYSLSRGSNRYIARARERLENTEGAMELLMSLVSFDPQSRATPLEVLNSRFMLSLREEHSPSCDDDVVHSFMAYSSSF